MNTPFAHLNIAAIRAERRARLRRTVSDVAYLGAVVLIALVLVNAMLTTALSLPDLTAQAELIRGM